MMQKSKKNNKFESIKRCRSIIFLPAGILRGKKADAGNGFNLMLNRIEE